MEANHANPLLRRLLVKLFLAHSSLNQCCLSQKLEPGYGPENCSNDNEKGIRIIFKCVDLGDPNVVETSVVWVLSMSKMLTVGRLPHDKVLRIIAQPRVQDGTIKQWQVIVWTDFAEADIDAWRSRKIWQH